METQARAAVGEGAATTEGGATAFEVIGLDLPTVEQWGYETVFIGLGCLDPINGDGCPEEYRRALDHAVAYGHGGLWTLLPPLRRLPEVQEPRFFGD